MGSRYGGLKQLDPMGPGGETVLDYSVYDALRAGFGRIVFVIRRDIEQPFRQTIGARYAGRVDIDYAFQQIDDLPPGFDVPAGRAKPWGTGHAVRAACGLVDGPFGVINADDFYGADAFAVLARYFAACRDAARDPFCMVGYRLQQTLSDHGAVNRGLCEARAGRLHSVREFTGIRRGVDGVIRGTGPDGVEQALAADALVSMNFWGFPGDVFDSLEARFVEFLRKSGETPGAEFYIPAFVDTQIRSGVVECTLLETSANWFGVTYPADKPAVQQRLRALVDSGAYPSPLLS
jgi:hypothetical protein